MTRRSWLVLPIALGAALAVLAGPAAPHMGCPGKDLHFKAADGTKLVAQRYGTGTTAVVLAHQADLNLCQWSAYGQRLAKLGYSAIAFDFRNYGESQARKSPADKRLPADVTAAVKFARSLGAKKVFLVGTSFGGWASVIAGAYTKPAVQGVIGVSTSRSWLSDAVPVARKLTVPALYIAAEKDGTAAEDAQALYDATAGADKAMKLVAGSDHGIDLITRSATVKGAIETFLRGH